MFCFSPLGSFFFLGDFLFLVVMLVVEKVLDDDAVVIAAAVEEVVMVLSKIERFSFFDSPISTLMSPPPSNFLLAALEVDFVAKGEGVGEEGDFVGEEKKDATDLGLSGLMRCKW